MLGCADLYTYTDVNASLELWWHGCCRRLPRHTPGPGSLCQGFSAGQLHGGSGWRPGKLSRIPRPTAYLRLPSTSRTLRCGTQRSQLWPFWFFWPAQARHSTVPPHPHRSSESEYERAAQRCVADDARLEWSVAAERSVRSTTKVPRRHKLAIGSVYEEGQERRR